MSNDITVEGDLYFSSAPNICASQNVSIFEDDGKFYPTLSYKECVSTALNLKMNIVVPDFDIITLDIDSSIWNCKTIKILKQIYPNLDNDKNIKITTSKSGNKHVYIKFDYKLDPIERLLIQCLLGSDLKREAHSYYLFKKGNLDTHSIMFEKKDNCN
jgi:hypothetical protein